MTKEIRNVVVPLVLLWVIAEVYGKWLTYNSKMEIKADFVLVKCRIVKIERGYHGGGKTVIVYNFVANNRQYEGRGGAFYEYYKCIGMYGWAVYAKNTPELSNFLYTKKEFDFFNIPYPDSVLMKTR